MSPSSGSADLIRPVALAVPSGTGFGLLWYPGPPVCLPGGSRAAAISLTHWHFRSGYKESHLGLLFDFRDACVSRSCSSMTVHFFFEPLIGAGKHCASASRSIHSLSALSKLLFTVFTDLIRSQTKWKYHHARLVNLGGRGRQMPCRRSRRLCLLVVVVEGTWRQQT